MPNSRSADRRRWLAAGAALAWGLGAAPANDNFAAAQAHTGSFQHFVDLIDATTEAGEPGRGSACGGGGAGHTAWYSLTVSSAKSVAATGYGSAGLTSTLSYVDVFTGSSLGSLTNVGCGDDSQTVSFDAAASTTYWIRVGADSRFVGVGLDVVVSESASADLVTTVVESADPVSIGGANLTYTTTVADTGSGGATGVSVATTLSGASNSIVSYSSSQGSCSLSGAVVTCALGSIAASTSATATVTVTPAATGTVTATSVATLNESDANSSDNTDAESTTVNNSLGCTIVGTAGNDTLNGTSGADVICGLGGNDTINGGNGNDTVYAGAGDDTVDGGNGDDTLYGGDGDDVMGGGNGADYLYGEAGTDTNYGETLLGSLLYLFDNGADHIYGGPGDDDLDGQNGNDVLYDHDGTDTMSGGLGNDSIDVQDGTGGDTANGDLGNDTCTVDGGDTTTGC